MKIYTLNDNDPFYSLEEYMLLPEYSWYETDRPWFNAMTGQEWITRYKLSKEMWEKYNNHPPFNSRVFVHVNGHGTMWCDVSRDYWKRDCPMRLLVDSDENDQNHFRLKNSREKFPNYSLLDRNFWWRSIYIDNDVKE